MSETRKKILRAHKDHLQREADRDDAEMRGLTPSGKKITPNGANVGRILEATGRRAARGVVASAIRGARAPRDVEMIRNAAQQRMAGIREHGLKMREHLRSGFSKTSDKLKLATEYSRARLTALKRDYSAAASKANSALDSANRAKTVAERTLRKAYERTARQTSASLQHNFGGGLTNPFASRETNFRATRMTDSVRQQVAAPYQKARDELASRMRQVRRLRDARTAAEASHAKNLFALKKFEDSVTSAQSDLANTVNKSMLRVRDEALRKMEAAAPTRMQRLAMKITGVSNTAAEDGAKKAAGTIASRATSATSINFAGAASHLGTPTTIAGKTLKYGVGKPLGLIPKAGSLVPKAIESIGKAVFIDPSKATTRLGRGIASVGRGLTSATGVASGFAMDAWIDAGSEYLQYRRDKIDNSRSVAELRNALANPVNDQGKLMNNEGVAYLARALRNAKNDGELGGSTIQRLYGHDIKFKNPTLADVLLSKTFWSNAGAKAVNSAVRTVTLGLYNPNRQNSDDYGPTSDEMSTRVAMGYDPMTGAALKDIEGNDVSEVIRKAGETAVAAQAQRADEARIYAALGGRLSADDRGDNRSQAGKAISAASNIDLESYRSLVAKTRDDWNAELANAEAIRDDFANSDIAKSGTYRARIARDGVDAVAAKYYEDASGTINRKYGGRMDDLLRNGMADKLAEANRDRYYQIMTKDRSWAADAAASGADRDYYMQFNSEWANTSQMDKLLMDLDAVKKEFEGSYNTSYSALDKAAQGTTEETK